MVPKQQTTNRLTAAAVQDFASRLRGELIQPSDATYDSVRKATVLTGGYFGCLARIIRAF